MGQLASDVFAPCSEAAIAQFFLMIVNNTRFLEKLRCKHSNLQSPNSLNLQMGHTVKANEIPTKNHISFSVTWYFIGMFGHRRKQEDMKE